ncbi:hypothetical protein CTEN210_16051 [Chaetoceros tenuissimus]|uniref:Plastid lipid-associated protein/fibrillin conserved domain-containing protein n=1 Tax=Chaetoceros tenuissimus TaxID=426638 RepID=A0AAD3DAV4_9STRA|nr:hypothetical protein CTEN210_16051 [Chaetoceros tenuissimus]
MDEFTSYKEELLQTIQSSKPSLNTVTSLVNQLEQQAELVGVGQASSSSGLLNGTWECIYAPQDLTRCSPFFWAFARAVDQSKEIYDITDSIPAPLKEIGPALQDIDLEKKTLVSKVKVATFGLATRCDILREEGLDRLRLKVSSTKPEESTVLKKLGPLGDLLDEQILKPFPSGEALEQVREGSSEVIMCTTFCDESLRISRNADAFNEVFVWVRKDFGENSMSMEF